MTVRIWNEKRKERPTAKSILQERKKKSGRNTNSIQSYRGQRLDWRPKGVRGDQSEDVKR